ncbi:hypothetical protein SRHO_G00341210 [Serrasalmus rhombeus]
MARNRLNHEPRRLARGKEHSQLTLVVFDMVWRSPRKAKQFFLERIFTLEEATDEAPESVVTVVCEILQDHSVDLLDRAGRKLGPKL